MRESLLNGAASRSSNGLVGPSEVSRAVRRSAGVRGDKDLLSLERTARAEFLGAGPVLQPLLDDPQVSDVVVNGDGSVWVDRGSGLRAVPGRLRAVRELATRLAAASGQRLDDAAPVAEGRLPDGTRLHALLPPLCAEGAVLSLRTMRTRAFGLDELRASGMLDDRSAQVLERLVQVRANVLVSGATGTGKTTLVASALSLVPPGERIICIEEAAELAPDHPHVLHLQVRRPNVQGAGEITLPDLVRTAMRMRPDRLVLGECRGAEVREVLGALNTGHDGGWATVHANAARDVPARLVALGALAGMSPATVAVQARSAVHAVVHLVRREGRRRLTEVAVLRAEGAEGFRAALALRCDRRGELAEAEAWPELARTLDDAGR
ncbi:TadA family conjugal transfer-associated ATPase [Ruania halotolerans]|uniref:TadA family conjugal transfer-associated ATPase n=1 Tax=Ruania halotolerans TaxID=2897773 RepID=UPI001E306159|nr:TadA family conjugal transfer-associated ATPase [Ruania halotolerans]UFU07134.1 TadA family conjugal transfer-associated ATPase [Ruania halotolerans]